MKQTYLNKLEFNRIQEILETFCVTYTGKEIARNLMPSSSIDAAKVLLEETTEAHILIYRLGNPPIDILPNITVALKKLDTSGSLSTLQLLEIAKVLKLALDLKEYFASSQKLTTCENLGNYFSKLYSNPSISNAIFTSILDENIIDDRASSTLMQIRKNIRKKESDIRLKLASYLNTKYIQEPVVTIRAGRFVIPVKQEYRSEVKGFVHDISSSGSTLFIEPMSVFDLNNDLNHLRLEENIEIQKILDCLSALLVPIINELKSNVELIGKIDFCFAKAKYAISISGVEPVFSREKQIDLKNARHPLINPDTVVPISINLGKTFNCLIITGPNTGGKTVTLKTVRSFMCNGSFWFIHSGWPKEHSFCI